MEQDEMKYFTEMMAQTMKLTDELIQKINLTLTKLDNMLEASNQPVAKHEKVEKKYVSYYSIIKDQYLD